MNKKSQNANNNGAFKDYLLIIIIAVIGMAVTAVVFFRIYIISRQSIINMWSSKTLIMAEDINDYLRVPSDAVLFASKGVEDMIDRGASNEEINDFLLRATGIYAELIEGNNTGIYGYVGDEYLDSSGWIPPFGYDPRQRPWYIDAVNADGEIAYVEPYINVQTSTHMTSVSKLLKDKKSVLSMDIFLGPLQRICEDTLENKEIESAFIVDSSGIIVAHSDGLQIGRDYSNDKYPYHQVLLEEALEKDSNVFNYLQNGVLKIAFTRRINTDWYAIYTFDDKVIFSSIIYVYLSSGIVLIIVLIALVLAMRLFRKKHIEARQLQSELAAIADIYLSLSILDLKGLKLNKMWVSEWLTNILSAKQYSLTRPDEIAEGIAMESFRPMLAKFMDFPTLAERLQNTKSISHDFLSIDDHWIRMHFIAGNRDKKGNLESVIWATESIDEDKRRQEEYREKAETDTLTKILNRHGGEVRLHDTFRNGTKGMLLFIDVVNFKYVKNTYGHSAGDRVIISIANCLMDSFRDYDIIFRLGGDEFAVFVTAVENKEVGMIVAKKLFTGIDSIDIPDITDWKPAISVGATFCDPSRSDSIEEYFKQADTAMYESKQKEGNYINYFK